MINAAIFDMDGTIIDSEPFWAMAEHEVFSELGINVTPQDTKITAALTTKEVIEYWHKKKPWEGHIEDAENKVVQRVSELVKSKGEPMPGAIEALELCMKNNIRLALCTNSPVSLIKLVLNRLQLQNTFEILTSGELEERGKPHPAVYQTALKLLKIEAHQAIAIEDTPTGVKSANQAGIKTIAVSNIRNPQEMVEAGANICLTNLHEFTQSLLHNLTT